MGAFKDFFGLLFNNQIKESIINIPQNLKDSYTNVRIYEKVQNIDRIHTVEGLDRFYNRLPENLKNIDEIKQAYDIKKDELKGSQMNTTGDLVLGYIGKQLANAVYYIRDQALPKVYDWIDSVLSSYNVQAEEINNIKSLASTGEFGLNAVVSFILGVSVQPAISTSTAPIWEGLGQQAYRKINVTLLDISTLLLLHFRNEISNEEYTEQLLKKGISPENISLLEKAFLFKPGAADIVTFGRRDIFSPETVEFFGYDKNIPKLPNGMLKAAGLSEDQFLLFWEAHWRDVESNLAGELLHRRQISEEEYDIILRSANYPPNIVDKMRNISYNPYTRVDVRRMYEAGIVSEEEVYNTYLDLGYDSEHAENLTNWTISEYTQENKNLTKAEIIKGYKEDEFSEKDCQDLLKMLGYGDDEVNFYITMANIEKARVILQETIDSIYLNYVNGVIKREEAKLLLTKEELTDYQIEKTLKKADKEILSLIKIPSLENVKEWYILGLIDQSTCKEKLKDLRYKDNDIELFIKGWTAK
jgi:hypothetical protein